MQFCNAAFDNTKLSRLIIMITLSGIYFIRNALNKKVLACPKAIIPEFYLHYAQKSDEEQVSNVCIAYYSTILCPNMYNIVSFL